MVDLEILREVNMLSIAVRFCLALLLGGLLGMERGRKNRPAGLRTYMLVCVGSSLVMMINQYVYQHFETSDPVRMGAQVISGIGFLCAGTILTTGKSQVKGITTAAGLWSAACIGLAIGIGFYEGAIFGGLSILLVMSVLQRMDIKIRSRSKIIDLYLELEPDVPLQNFIMYARDHNFEISDLQLSKNKVLQGISTCVILTAKSHEAMAHTEIVEVLSRCQGVLYLEEIRD